MSKVTDVMRIMSEELDRYRNSIPRKAFTRAMERVIIEVIAPPETTPQNPAAGIDIIKRPEITADELADLLSGCCPPFCCEHSDVHCDVVSCRDCWLAWLATGQAPQEGGGQ